MANSDNDTENDTTKKDAIAVALRYEPDSEYAPKVVAGGRGSVAEQILEIAFANGIKVREDQDLAEVLSSIDIDSEIPVEAFAAVAGGVDVVAVVLEGHRERIEQSAVVVDEKNARHDYSWPVNRYSDPTS